MKVVLDSNEFIFALKDKELFSANLLQLVGVKFDCIIPELILNEIVTRLKFIKGKNFSSLARYWIKTANITILPDNLVKQSLVDKYISKGAKPADAFIAAFAEWVDADYIVSENRHFLKEIKLDRVKVTDAKGFMKILLSEK